MTRNQLEDEIRSVIGRKLTGIPGTAELSERQVDDVMNAITDLEWDLIERDYDERDADDEREQQALDERD